MARKNESPQKAAMKEMMRSSFKENDIRIKNGTDVNTVMRDTMSVILEDVLDEEFGYSKYDYHNKNTDKQPKRIFQKDHAHQLWGHGCCNPTRPERRV